MPKKKKIFLGIILFLLLSSPILYYIFFPKVKDSQEKTFNPTEVIMFSTERPSEKEVKDFEVPADMPKRINLPTIDTSGYIQSVGIDQNGDIAVPSNVLMAGWYVSSSRPGDAGLSIITGHRDGVLKGGVFRYIGNLKKGDVFEIEYGDSSLKYFKVVEVRSVSIEEAYDLLYEQREGIKEQLNLISCSGTYDKTEATYDQRIIVVSEKIDN